MYVPPRQRAPFADREISYPAILSRVLKGACPRCQEHSFWEGGFCCPANRFEGSTRTFSRVERYFMPLLFRHNPYMVHSCVVGLILPIWKTSIIHKTDQSRCLRNVVFGLLPICVVARCTEFLCWDDVDLFCNALHRVRQPINMLI